MRQNGVMARPFPLAEDAEATDAALTSLELASDRAEIRLGAARLRLDARGTAIVAALLGARGFRLRRVERVLSGRRSRAEERFFGLIAEDNDAGSAFVARLGDLASPLAVHLRGTTIRLTPRGGADFAALLHAAPWAIDRVARRLGVEAAPSGPSGLVEPNRAIGFGSSLTPLASRDAYGGPTGPFGRVRHSLGIFRHR